MIKTLFNNPIDYDGVRTSGLKYSDKRILKIAAICMTLALMTYWLGGYHALFLTLNAWLYPILPDSVWQGITVLGDTRIILALSLLFIYRFPFLLPATLVATIPALLFSQGVKNIVDTSRPPKNLDVSQFHHIGELLKNHSFPSGHATTIGIFVAMMLFISTKPWQRVSSMVLLVLVGLSRIAVGVHWPVDVFSGLALGLVCGYVGLMMVKHYNCVLSNRYMCWALIALPLYSAISVLFGNYGYALVYPFMIAISMTALIYYLYEWISGAWLIKRQVADHGSVDDTQ